MASLIDGLPATAGLALGVVLGFLVGRVWQARRLDALLLGLPVLLPYRDFTWGAVSDALRLAEPRWRALLQLHAKHRRLPRLLSSDLTVPRSLAAYRAREHRGKVISELYGWGGVLDDNGVLASPDEDVDHGFSEDGRPVGRVISWQRRDTPHDEWRDYGDRHEGRPRWSDVVREIDAGFGKG